MLGGGDFHAQHFSIHAPSRERRVVDDYIRWLRRFQSTLPRGSDLNATNTFFNILHNFNPRSLIGATYGGIYLCSSDRYFNPRSLTGATANVFTTSGGDLFQSTLPYGSDGTTFASGLEEVISIHAPLRERRIAALSTVRPLPFQSTLPYGSDIISRQSRSTINNFNPRSLTGATTTHPAFQCRYTISIHAPSRERLPLDGALFKLQAFQSTLPHGSDTSSAHRSCDYVYFNPRSLTGATASKEGSFSIPLPFQSTLPHGSDRMVDGSWNLAVGFQSTLPHGSDNEVREYLTALKWEFQSTLPHGSDMRPCGRMSP